MNKSLLKQTLPEPQKHPNVPENAKWLAGEGAGSWFCVQRYKSCDRYAVERWSPTGQLECSGLFTCLDPQKPDLNEEYHIAHLSHCGQVCIEQKGIVTKLLRLNFEQ